MKNHFSIFKTILAFLFLIGLALGLSQLLFQPQKAEANLNHSQIFPHTKVWQTDYMPDGWNSPAKDPAVLEFMAKHYDAMTGVHNLSSYTNNPPVQLSYVNYYCVYVGNAEYQDMQNWANSHGVNFEDFFIHYSAPTHACYGSTCYDLPAGSRVPTYDWYGTSGDMTKTGARIVTNPGNPNYRAWKLDELSASFNANPILDGVMIDNTVFNGVGVKTPTTTSGGAITEYPTNPDATYGNDLLTLFSEFKTKFGNTKVQVPNTSQVADDPRMYPYIWAVFREATLQPNKNIWFPTIYNNIANSEAAGVQNIMTGVIAAQRYEMSYLAEYYMIKTSSTYIHPFQAYIADQWGIDPRQNQWFGAVGYNIGQPVNDPQTAQKFKSFSAGIDPSSSLKDSFTVSAIPTFPSAWGTVRLTDNTGTKNWPDGQWNNKKMVFPNGALTTVYKSGSNWIELYENSWTDAMKANFTLGTYQLGSHSYYVVSREFENALVLLKPLGSNAIIDDTSATTENLPVTSDNPSGRYYLLNNDGTVSGAPLTQVSLRNTDGVILIKESALSRPSISKSVDKASASSGDTLTYTITYSNPSSITFSNAKIADPIPTGTVFDSIVSGSATFDGTNVVLDLGNLAPNTNGSISFKVRVQ